MPRDLEFFFLYQHSGRFPDSQIITQSRLPKYFKTVLSGCSVFSVTAHSRMALYSLLTVTSSYRTCTCFPFHRSQLHIACHKSDSNACLLRHLYATYSVSSCVAYAIAWIIILQLVTLFNRFLSDALQTHLQKRCKKLQNTLQQPACK